MNKLKWGWVAAACAMASPAFADYALNMSRGVSTFSGDVYELHMTILWICVVIGIVVFGAMFYSMYAHRKSRGHEPARFSHSTRAEVLWTVIPVIILVVMAVPATRTLIKMERTGDAEMTVKITGYQWKWRYEYIEDDINILSTLDAANNAARRVNSGINPYEVPNYLLEVDNPLVLPTDTKIRFLLTADDVIHSWWVPEFGWKRDAIPDFINEAWVEITEPGVYRGQCAELCGKDHGFMPIVVIAKEPDEYLAWVDSQHQEQQLAKESLNREWAMDELLAQGEQVYERQCAACHQSDGNGLSPAFPALAGSDVATGPVDQHIDVVVNGRPGTAMQAFGDLLNESDIAAALTYTRNAWGNDTKQSVQRQSVQPRDIQAAKRG